MPLNEKTYAEARKENPLEITASDFYFDTMRPHLEKMLATCRTDPELIRTIEKVINAADSFCAAKNYEALSESFDVLNTAITDKTYFNGAMKRGSEEEKSMVRDLATKISDMRMIIQCEPPVTPETPSVKERLNYSSPIGENQDFGSHNMKNLNTPQPKRRIPNN